MATFPELEPFSRQYSLGMYPLSIESSFAGGDARFKHGGTRTGVRLNLGYVFLTNEELKLIRDHYRLQDGTFLAFTLPSIIWAGHTSPSNIISAFRRWKYVGPPEETHLSGGYADATVQLISIR